MKISAMQWVAFTTLFLVLITIGATLNVAFRWIFFATVAGQAMVILMVYKVLRDRYTTEKTFEHYYEDHPIDSN